MLWNFLVQTLQFLKKENGTTMLKSSKGIIKLIYFFTGRAVQSANQKNSCSKNVAYISTVYKTGVMELIYKFPNDPCNLLGIGITHGLRNKTEKSFRLLSCAK